MVGRSSGCLCCRWAVNIPVWPSTPRPPAGPPSITEAECVTVCEAVEWAPAGWGAWLGPTDNRTFQNRVISYRGEGAWEGLVAMTTGLGAQACTGHRRGGSCEWGRVGGRGVLFGQMRGDSFRTLAVGSLCPALYNEAPFGCAE